MAKNKKNTPKRGTPCDLDHDEPDFGMGGMAKE